MIYRYISEVLMYQSTVRITALGSDLLSEGRKKTEGGTHREKTTKSKPLGPRRGVGKRHRVLIC